MLVVLVGKPLESVVLSGNNLQLIFHDGTYPMVISAKYVPLALPMLVVHQESTHVPNKMDGFWANRKQELDIFLPTTLRVGPPDLYTSRHLSSTRKC